MKALFSQTALSLSLLAHPLFQLQHVRDFEVLFDAALRWTFDSTIMADEQSSVLDSKVLLLLWITDQMELS